MLEQVARESTAARAMGVRLPELLDPGRFSFALRDVARHHARSGEGYGLVLFVPRERHGTAALAMAVTLAGAAERAVGVVEDGVFGVVLMPCTTLDVERLVSCVEGLSADMLAEGGLPPAHVVSAARLSGTRRRPAWLMRRSTLEALCDAFGLARDMGPDALTGPTYVGP